VATEIIDMTIVLGSVVVR